MALQTESSGTSRSLDITSGQTLHDRPSFARPRCVCRFDDGEVFAYAERGHELVRASDRELWAFERDDELVSARSGVVLARRRGRVFFSAETDEPLYYERAV